MPCSSFPAREGTYLYFDDNRSTFIHSGKVTGHGFQVRNQEHAKCASATKSTSNFYFLYPSRTTQRSEKRDKQGVFESRIPVIAAGFEPNSLPATSVGRDYKEGGILIFSETDKSLIKSSTKGKKMIDLEKFQSILAYQFEFGYDLAINPNLNVSRSPGFESFLGIFGGQ